MHVTAVKGYFPFCTEPYICEEVSESDTFIECKACPLKYLRL